MVDSHPNAPQDDEVILCVRYRAFSRWIGVVFLLGLGAAFCEAVYSDMARGDYLKAFSFGLGALLVFGFGTEVLFTRHILFYRDRVVKEWYLLGQRMIPYTRAKLVVNPASIRYVVWLYPAKGKTEPCRIRETDDEGRVRPIQMPIAWGLGYVNPETLDKLEALLSYLVGVEDKSKLYVESRVFAKSILPKDILCQDQDQDQKKTYNSWLGLKL